MMRPKTRRSTIAFLPVAALAITLSFVACNSSTGPRVGPPAGSTALVQSPVLTERLALSRYYSGYEERARRVIRTTEEWSEIWTQLTGNIAPRPPLPPVNFDHEIVLFVAMGQRATGGYSIDIEGVYEKDGRVFVDVRERSPGGSCIVTQALTQPVDAVRVPRRDGPVTFLERAETVSCQ